MAKPRRGKNVKAIDGWRGTCPVCKRSAVKLLWTAYDENDKEISVCKHCGK